MTVEMEVHRKIYDDENRGSLTVRPDCDGLGLVEIDGGEDYGRLVCSVEVAEALVEALNALVGEMKNV